MEITYRGQPTIIAFYLPQFHPTPENDEWWGNGFTEWTNVTKAKPLFRGHHQPNLPADLGFYDLRLAEVREEQASMAKDYGIGGFAYWHYWFSGRRILERPFNEVLDSGKPDFPFCLAWANETWSGIWHGRPNDVLIRQEYPGEGDYRKHYEYARTAFQDDRYLTMNQKPIFIVYRPKQIPNSHRFIDLWNKWAIHDGFSGVQFIAISNNVEKDYNALIKKGYNGVIPNRLSQLSTKADSLLSKIWRKSTGKPFVLSYAAASRYFIGDDEEKESCYPVLIPNWDNSPRSGKRALILKGSSPELFGRHVESVLALEKRLVFLKSWNEWAEGNYMEPDHRFGRGYLEVLKNILSENS